MYKGKYAREDAEPRKKHPTVKQSQLLQKQAAPKEQPDAAEDPPKEKPKHSKVGTIVFYSIYGVLTLGIIVGIIILMVWLNGWLVRFEASQPDKVSQDIYQEMFSSPDWKKLYQTANEKNGYLFDSAEEYADFMAKKLEDATITMVETSAGLSGGKKYIIRATFSNGKYMDFATFTLTDRKKEGDKISNWQLNEVVLRVDSSLVPKDPIPVTYQYTFLIDSANTVTVDGKVLDESHILRTVTTKATEYLPEGVTGYTLSELSIDGLTKEPQVTVTDPQGNEIPMNYDAATRTYTQDLSQAPIGETENTTLLNAATTYCLYMIEKAGKSQLKQYFDSSKPVYNSIATTDPWMQGFSRYEFSEERTVSGYYRYSDTLFSARVTLTLNVTRGDGSVKPYELDTTFFLEKQGEKWMVIDMTNVDVQEQITNVRMTFLQTYGTLIHSEIVSADSKSFASPNVEIPEGKTFRGWAIKTVGENGENVFAVTYLPNADGVINVSSTLSPTTLYAIFGTAEVE